MKLERTDAAQAEFDGITDGLDVSEDPPPVVAIDTPYDMFADDEPLACGLADVDVCESCQ